MKKVIEIALGYEGFREGANNANPFAEFFASEYPNFYNGDKRNQPWCDVFVDYCFCKAYGVETAKKLLCQPSNSLGAGCIYSARYFQQQGRFFSSEPQEGDQIFFGSASNCYHTGLVIGVENGRVLTIEGNTSDSVARRSYALGSSEIYGYGRPEWSIVDSGQLTVDSGQAADGSGQLTVDSGQAADGSGQLTVDSGQRTESAARFKTVLVAVPELSVNDGVYEAVRAMQALLNLRLGARLDTDGEFGMLTKAAVMSFQSVKGLGVDGICGKQTWTALIGG